MKGNPPLCYLLLSPRATTARGVRPRGGRRLPNLLNPGRRNPIERTVCAQGVDGPPPVGISNDVHPLCRDASRGTPPLLQAVPCRISAAARPLRLPLSPAHTIPNDDQSTNARAHKGSEATSPPRSQARRGNQVWLTVRPSRFSWRSRSRTPCFDQGPWSTRSQPSFETKDCNSAKLQ